MIGRFIAAAVRRPRLLVTLYVIALARAAWPRANVGCQGDGCKQGDRPERCNCHLANAWATTSDPASHARPVAGPHRAAPTPTSSVMRMVDAGELPAPHRQMTAEMWDDAAHALPMRWRDWVIAMVVVGLASALAGYMSGGAT